MKARTSHGPRRATLMAATLVGLGLSLGGCMHDEPVTTVTAGPAPPNEAARPGSWVSPGVRRMVCPGHPAVSAAGSSM